MRFKKQETKDLIQAIPTIIDHEYQLNDLYTVFHGLGLLKVELQTIFHFADVNKNQKIDKDEWTNFYQLFLQGFISCDSTGDFLLSLDELNSCGEIQPSFTHNHLTGDFLFKVYGKSVTGTLNLDNYLYLRRMLFGWEECSNNLEMPLSHITCGLEIAAPLTSQYASYAFDIFHQIQKLKLGVVDPNQAVHLNIQDYLLLAFIYTQFENYEFPCRDGILSKRDLSLAVQQEKAPGFLTPKVLEALFFDHKNTVDFNDFSIFYYVVVLFNRFASPGIGLAALDTALDEQQFTDLLEDEFFPVLVKSAIQNVQLPDSQAITQVQALKDQNHKMTAEQFFTSFLQLKQEEKGTPENYKAVLKIIYRMFENDNLKTIGFNDFYHFYKFSTIFIQADTVKNNFINELQLRSIINEPQQLPLKCSSDELMTLNNIIDLIQESKQTSVNIKQLLSISHYKNIFQRVQQKQVSQQGNTVDTLGVTFALDKLHMFIDPTSLKEAQQGKDPFTHQPLYNYQLIFQKSLANEGYALRLAQGQPQE